MIEVGSCERYKAQDVVITIKRPWWALWRKNKVITIPKAEVSIDDSYTKYGDSEYHISITPSDVSFDDLKG